MTAAYIPRSIGSSAFAIAGVIAACDEDHESFGRIILFYPATMIDLGLPVVESESCD